MATANIAEKMEQNSYLPFHIPRKRLGHSSDTAELFTDPPILHADGEIELFERIFEGV